MRLPAEVSKKIAEEARRGKIVIIHPCASRKFSGPRLATVDYPR